jgi:hypothetical protein
MTGTPGGAGAGGWAAGWPAPPAARARAPGIAWEGREWPRGSTRHRRAAQAQRRPARVRGPVHAVRGASASCTPRVPSVRLSPPFPSRWALPCAAGPRPVRRRRPASARGRCQPRPSRTRPPAAALRRRPARLRAGRRGPRGSDDTYDTYVYVYIYTCIRIVTPRARPARVGTWAQAQRGSAPPACRARPDRGSGTSALAAIPLTACPLAALTCSRQMGPSRQQRGQRGAEGRLGSGVELHEAQAAQRRSRPRQQREADYANARVQLHHAASRRDLQRGTVGRGMWHVVGMGSRRVVWLRRAAGWAVARSVAGSGCPAAWRGVARTVRARAGSCASHHAADLGQHPLHGARVGLRGGAAGGAALAEERAQPAPRGPPATSDRNRAVRQHSSRAEAARRSRPARRTRGPRPRRRRRNPARQGAGPPRAASGCRARRCGRRAG